MATATASKGAARGGYGLLSRILDPDNLMDPEILSQVKGATPSMIQKGLAQLDLNLSDCMTRMARRPNHGGNPFLFSIAVSKQHILVADEELAEICERVRGKRPSFVIPCPTAATDGKYFYWHPLFLSTLEKTEVPIVMEHEVYHTLFRHFERMLSALARQRNWAMDYTVNACIETNWNNIEKSGRGRSELWGGNLGVPISFKDLLEHIDGKADHFPVTGSKDDPARIFADVTLYGRSPESIYDEIMEHWDRSPRKCPKCAALSLDPKTKKPRAPGPCSNRPHCKHKGDCCPHCGACGEKGASKYGYGDGMPGSMDGHIDPKVSKADIENDLLKAAAVTKNLRGTVPAGVEELIAELTRPTLKFVDVLFSDCMRKAQEAGLRNDWLRPRKRWIPHGLYLPKRFTHRPRLLFLLDTSGSMSAADMAYVISQLQVLVARGVEVVVVPVDAKPHWDAKTTVDDIRDLKTVKVKGRGGTVFEEFFRDFRKYVGMDFDAIAIGTDGDCGEIPMRLRPPMPVNWVLTRHKSGWKPSFGRVLPHRDDRM